MDCKVIGEFCVLLFLCVGTTFSAPPKARASYGPCVGMDCMHGILMHGDKEQGQKHAAEDTFNKLQAIDAIRGKKSGPCKGMDCLHGVLMHNDKEAGVGHDHEDKDAQQAGPKKAQQQGPCQGMDCLHGVMMHGDEQQGIDHKKHDLRKIKVDSAKNVKRGPCKGMDCMHGVLMHGDDKQGVEHAQEHAQMRDKVEGVISGAANPEELLHGTDQDEHRKVDDAVVEVDDEVEQKIKEQVTQDYQDYQEWKKERDAEKSKDGGLWGFSLPFISDAGDSDADFQKWKYLAELLAREKGNQDEDGKDRAESSGIDHDDNTDMRHELFNIGNTDTLKFKPHRKHDLKRVIHDEE